MSSIVPSIGRKVWFWSNLAGNAQDPKQAFDATIVFVHNSNRVNLVYTNHWGTSGSLSSVLLEDPSEMDAHGGSKYGNEPYATWMPFQVGQAKTAV